MSKLDQIDIPAVGVLYQARQLKTASWKRVKSIRAKIKQSPLWAGNLRLELLKAEACHGEAIAMERSALGAIERRALELGFSREIPMQTVNGAFDSINPPGGRMRVLDKTLRDCLGNTRRIEVYDPKAVQEAVAKAPGGQS